MPNPVTWFEIIGNDPIKLQKFYKDVFAWKLGDPMPEMGNYSLLDNEGHGIGGGVGSFTKTSSTGSSASRCPRWPTTACSTTKAMASAAGSGATQPTRTA